MKNLAAALCAISSIMGGLPALAQISAQDTWDNMVFYTGTFGSELTATLTETDNGLHASDVTVTFNPNNENAAAIHFGDVTLVELPDGSVALEYPEKQQIKFQELGQGESEAATFRLDRTGLIMKASGSPGDVTYTTTADMFEFELLEAQFESENTQLDKFEVAIFSQGLTATVRVNTTSGIEQTARHDQLKFTMDIAQNGEERQTISYSARNAETGYDIGFPENKFRWSELSSSLRDGLKFGFNFGAEASDATAIFHDPETPPILMEVSVENSLNAYALDLSGLQYKTEQQNLDLVFTEMSGDIPPISTTLGKFGLQVLMPVLASETAQSTTIAAQAENLQIAALLWDMVDPEKNLPRDPMNFLIDLEYMITTNTGLFDLDKPNPGVEPTVMIDTVEIRDVLISGLGVNLVGDGKVAIDFDGMEPFSGVPNFGGKASFRLSGAYGLLERLLHMNFMTAEDAFGVRAALGMVMKPDGGPDDLVSEIEADRETGAITVNGLRIR